MADVDRLESCTVTAIERRVLLCLARRLDREPDELELELRLAHEDLPVDAEELLGTVGWLEAELGVTLPRDESCLSYVRDFSIAIQTRMMAAMSAAAAL